MPLLSASAIATPSPMADATGFTDSMPELFPSIAIDGGGAASVRASGTRPVRVITYGTFDLFHIGHLRLLQRLRALGDHLTVGVSTDEFNALKGKSSIVPYADRAAIVASCRYVDAVVPEHDWAQKRRDIAERRIDVFGMGEDWAGKFDELGALCRVVYLPRTSGISSTSIKDRMKVLDGDSVSALKGAIDVAQQVLARLA